MSYQVHDMRPPGAAATSCSNSAAGHRPSAWLLLKPVKIQWRRLTSGCRSTTPSTSELRAKGGRVLVADPPQTNSFSRYPKKSERICATRSVRFAARPGEYKLASVPPTRRRVWQR